MNDNFFSIIKNNNIDNSNIFFSDSDSDNNNNNNYNNNNNINIDFDNTDILKDLEDLEDLKDLENLSQFDNKNINNDNKKSNILVKLNSFDEKISNNLTKQKKSSLIILSLLEILFKNDINKDKLEIILNFLMSKKIIDDDILNTKYNILKDKLSFLINSFKNNDKIEDLNNFYRNNYNQLKLLGQGSFGTVYKSYHKIEKKYYAIKKIFLTDEILSENINLFNETFLHCNLEHENIVKYYSSWILKDFQSVVEFNKIIDLNDMDIIKNPCPILFIQMELCDFTLGEYFLTQMIDDSVKRRILYFNDIVQGIQYLQSQNIIHRDLKPNNIFFVQNKNNEFVAKIGDFGLCKKQNFEIENENENEKINHNENNLIAECPNCHNLTDELIESQNNKDLIILTNFIEPSLHQAPEIKKNQPNDFSSDIYSLGIIFLEMISNFKTEYEKIKKISQIRSDPTKIIECQNIKIHIYDEIIIKMLSNDKNKRPNIKQISDFINKN